MNSEVFSHIFRFFFLFVLQVLVLKNIEMGGAAFNYIQLIIYPLFLFILPFKTSRAYLLLLGFALGLGIDVFYNTLGVHASASVFTAYIRPMVLAMLEPRGGYSAGNSPNRYRMGNNWFARYAAVMLAAHLLFLFSVEAFSVVYLPFILLKTLASFVPSYLLLMVYMFIFNPKD
jgi:hypothetical protein